MRKAILISLISVIIIILTLIMLPFALNADITWKSATVSFVLPATPNTYNWSNPNGENINYVLVSVYWIANPTQSFGPAIFGQDNKIWFYGVPLAVTGIGTPKVSVYLETNVSPNAWQEVIEYRWGESVRTRELSCWRVWINEDGKFQFIFLWPYRDNNWVKIYDKAGNEVFKADLPYDNPNLIVDLPNGMYLVKTFHVDPTTPIQTFVIGKP